MYKIEITPTKCSLIIKEKNITYTVLFDRDDLDKIEYKFWSINKQGYAHCGCLPLHRLVMGDPRGKHVHHINGNKLDNRKSNLRIMSPKEHARLHCSQHKNKTSEDVLERWFKKAVRFYT